MVQEAFIYHTVLVYLFLALLVVSLLTPWLFGGNLTREIKATRISFFIFSAIISMVAFSGVILFLIAKEIWSVTITLMVIVLVLLSAIEVSRSKKLTKTWRENKSAASLSWRYVGVQILVTLSMIAISLYRGKDAVSLP